MLCLFLFCIFESLAAKQISPVGETIKELNNLPKLRNWFSTNLSMDPKVELDF